MKFSRRGFLKGAAIAGAGMALPTLPFKWNLRRAHAFYQSSPIQRFIQPLRGNTVGSLVTDIGVAASDGPRTWGSVVADHYTIGIQEFSDQLLPDPTNATKTKLWGFVPANYLAATPSGPRHLSGIIVAQKGKPVQITFQNNLPSSHIIPVDTTIIGANQAQNRTAVHIHGGYVPWISDGGPFDWWAPDGSHGQSFLNNQVLRPGETVYNPITNPTGTIKPNEAEYYFPNDQSARLVWYHDHAFGITRINAYAGIATGYIIRDGYEASLIKANGSGIPDYIEKGGREIPIVIQDKIFVDGDNTSPNYIGTVDPSWPGPVATGSLWYAHEYDSTRWELSPGFPLPPNPSVIPEFFGDTMLVNGTVYPEATVEARRYRFRVLNACNARFLNLQLYVEDNNGDSITLDPVTLAPTNPPGPPFLVIGAEGGFLPKPVSIPSNQPFNLLTLGGSLITAPAERWDIIVDFKGYENKNLILYNDAPAPFPGGDPLYDFFASPVPGSGPNTRQIMRFKVGSTVSPAEPTLSLPASLAPGNDPLLATLVPGGIPKIPRGARVRSLTLNEGFDEYGRLTQWLGTNFIFNANQGYGRAYLDPATEVVLKNAIEVWQIANLTGDTHPIHFHLVNVQVISRQPFDSVNYNGKPVYLGPALPPPPEEAGWKETVKMHPGEVTTVLMQFKLPTVPFTVPTSPRPAASQYAMKGVTLPPGKKAFEYVWHCHILEHEEHDMMRPLVVIG
jgi:spore coat protein A, manganese oxidase